MRVASGHIVDGRGELDSTNLPEGANVTVLFSEDEDTFEVDEETEMMLLESIAQGDRGETIPIEQLLDDLRRRE